MKFYSQHTLSNNYDIALNAIFRKSDFKMAFTEKFIICPSGLTMGCYAEGDEIKQFFVTVKKYGYESLSNNGTVFTDLSDYTTNDYWDERLTDEMKDFCVEYLKDVDFELYETVKKYYRK